MGLKFLLGCEYWIERVDYNSLSSKEFCLWKNWLLFMVGVVVFDILI